LWRDKCESYFEIFGISDALKPRSAALNFTGVAKAWLQTMELRGRFTNWDKLQQAVCIRFDRDQYSLHMKQLDSLNQTSSITEYHAKFEQLAHSILLYNPNYDDTFMVVRFLNGLKDEIRTPIALHQPKDVDTGSALALLQEELEARKWCYPLNKDSAKPSSKGFSAWEKNKSLSKKEDIRKADKTPGDEKISALFAHRKANGLCFTCGDNGLEEHTSAPEQVPIHILHELMELLQSDPAVESDSSDAEEETSEDCVMAVQEDQLTTLHSPKR
jgi:hypothetical protein